MHANKPSSKRLMGKNLYLWHLIHLGTPPPPPFTPISIWFNMLCGYCNILDPSIDNINAQPHASMNWMKSILKDNWEYVGYDLSYWEFKVQVNVFLNNKQNVLKFFIDASATRHNLIMQKNIGKAWNG